MIIKIYLRSTDEVAALYRALASNDNSLNEFVSEDHVLIGSEGKWCEHLVNDKKGVERKGELYLAQLEVAELYAPRKLYEDASTPHDEAEYLIAAKPIPINPLLRIFNAIGRFPVLEAKGELGITMKGLHEILCTLRDEGSDDHLVHYMMALEEIFEYFTSGSEAIAPSSISEFFSQKVYRSDPELPNKINEIIMANLCQQEPTEEKDDAIPLDPAACAAICYRINEILKADTNGYKSQVKTLLDEADDFIAPPATKQFMHELVCILRKHYQDLQQQPSDEDPMTLPLFKEACKELLSIKRNVFIDIIKWLYDAESYGQQSASCSTEAKYDHACKGEQYYDDLMTLPDPLERAAELIQAMIDRHLQVPIPRG